MLLLVIQLTIKIIEASQARIYNNYKNTRPKLLKTNAAIWFNKICKTKQLTPEVKHLNCKCYYQQLHLEYLCNLARYWLQAVWGWHDSVETCRSVIICEIIVRLLVIVLYMYIYIYTCIVIHINPLNAELHPICHLLALLGAHHILHISRIRVNVNCITNSSIWNTCVTRQGIDYNLPEDDTIVSKHVGLW